MLILPLKATMRSELHMQLATWLDGDYEVPFQKQSSSNPLAWVTPKPDFGSVACRKDLIRLASLRNCIADAIPKSDSHKNALEENALRDLHEYHAALLEFEKRGFPVLDDEHNGVKLLWKGAFGIAQEEVHSTLVWDRACTLWNAAALETCLCSNQEKVMSATSSQASKKEAYKQCIQHCQTAASILSILQQLAESEDYSTVDISKPMLNFWEKLLVAHAQTYVYKMVSSDDPNNAKHAMLSYLIMGAVSLYNEALTYAQDPRLQSEVPRQADEWGTYCKANSMVCSAKAEYHQAVVHRLKREWGHEIARLSQSLIKLQACRDFIDPLIQAKKKDSALVLDVQKEVNMLLDFVSDRKVRAEKENIQIYQADIPSKLPDITPKQMAKTNLGLPPTMLAPTVPLFVNL